MPWWSMLLISLTLMALLSQDCLALYQATMFSWLEIKKTSFLSLLSLVRLVNGSWNVPMKKVYVLLTSF